MLSVIIPVYNEEKNLGALQARIRESLSGVGDYEVIFVDDGSTDGSLAALKKIRSEDDRVRIVKLKRNFGQHAALAAGFDICKGDVAITIDADLQNDPADIKTLLEKYNEGYDFVSGIRKYRKDPFLGRKLPSKMVNIITSRITNVELKDYHCALKAYSREIVDGMKDYYEMRRCLPALAAKLSKRTAEVEVAHQEREGKSSYGFWSLFKLYFDFYLNFDTRMFLAIMLFGLVLFGLSLAVSVGYILSRMLGLVPPLAGLLYVLIFTGINSIQLIIFGLLGEYLLRIYKVVQDKDLYKIDYVE